MALNALETKFQNQDVFAESGRLNEKIANAVF